MKLGVVFALGLLLTPHKAAVALTAPPHVECKATATSIVVVSGYQELTTISFYDAGHVTFDDSSGTRQMPFIYVSSVDYDPIGLAPFWKRFTVQFEQGDVLFKSPTGYLTEDCLTILKQRYDGMLQFIETRV